MKKVAVLVLADSKTHAQMARVTNALQLAKECKENGDDVSIVFDGAGTTWIPKLHDEQHPLHESYKEVVDKVGGACRFCANAFDVRSEIANTDITLLGAADGHPSIRSLIVEGYQIVSF